MNIWVLEIGEPLPLEPGARLHRYGLLTRHLAAKGHEVTWWTSTFSHAQKQHFHEGTEKLLIDGVNVYLIKGPGYTKNISLARIQHQKDFRQQFLKLAENEPPPDLILAPVPTIDGAKAAMDYGLRHSVPYWVDICDLWPDELVQLLPPSFQWIGRLALGRSYSDMTEICKHAAGILGVSKCYVDYGLGFAGRDFDQGKDHIFYLGYTASLKDPKEASAAEAKLEKLGFQSDKNTLCFFGTLGQYFEIDQLLQVARKHPDLQFIIAGDGSRKTQYEAEASGLKNVIFFGWANAAEIQLIMEHSKVGIAPYKKGANMEMPNKPFEYMSGRLALLFSLRGELKELNERYNFGSFYEAGNFESLEGAILELFSDESDLEKKRNNSLALFQERFCHASLFNELEAFLKQSFDKKIGEYRPPYSSLERELLQ